MIIKKGFTLSEVMVTLGILGILAAILIPAITNSAPDPDKVMLKKAYSTAEQTISDLINDDVYYPANQTTTVGSVTYQRGFNYTDITAGMNIPASTNKFCYLLSERLNTVGASNCSTSADGAFVTSDGIKWTIHRESATEFPLDNGKYETDIVVDVNGNKNPNCWNDGPITGLSFTACSTSINVPDIFLIQVRYDGKIRVASSAAALLINPTNNSKGVGGSGSQNIQPNET